MLLSIAVIRIMQILWNAYLIIVAETPHCRAARGSRSFPEISDRKEKLKQAYRTNISKRLKGLRAVSAS